jgi:predicted ester cyclase
MAQDNAKTVRIFVDEVITKGNIAAAAEYVWEDVIEQVPLPGQGPGLDGLKDILRDLRTGFPDIVFSIHEQIAEHDKVVSRFEWTGTHKGEFLGIPATGRPGLGYCHRPPAGWPHQRHPHHHGHSRHDGPTRRLASSRYTLRAGASSFRAFCGRMGECAVANPTLAKNIARMEHPDRGKLSEGKYESKIKKLGHQRTFSLRASNFRCIIHRRLVK